jgi:hypothetical protein
MEAKELGPDVGYHCNFDGFACMPNISNSAFITTEPNHRRFDAERFLSVIAATSL